MKNLSTEPFLSPVWTIELVESDNFYPHLPSSESFLIYTFCINDGSSEFTKLIRKKVCYISYTLNVIKVFQVNLSWNFRVENKMFSSETLKSFVLKPFQDLLAIIAFVLRL